MSGAYIATTLFRDLKAEMRSEYPVRNVTFIAGCKGVGKTSLLRALYNDVCKNLTEYKVAKEDVYYLVAANTITSKDYGYGDICEKMLRRDSTGYLFIDNVHDVPPDRSHFKRILKDELNLKWQVVAASSRHGLFSLIKMKILSVDDFITNLCVLNPEEEVGKMIFEMSIKGKECKTARTAFLEDLALLGYVPGCIKAYVYFKCDLTAFKHAYASCVYKNIRSDAAQYSRCPDDDELYCKTLAILCCGNSVPLHPFHLAPALLPWTYLKHERRDDGDHVSAVNSLIPDICADYISSDTDHLVKRIKAMLQITGGELGNLGRFFEQLIRARLRAIRSITYFYYDNETTSVRSQELHLAPIKNFQCSNKPDVSGIQASGTASITHCPNAKDFDFLLVIEDHDDQTHGFQQFQVTFQTRKRKCNSSDFFEKGDATHIYLLTPQSVDVESVQKETSADTALGRAFRKNHLRIIDPLTVLTSEQLELLRQCSAN